MHVQALLLDLCCRRDETEGPCSASVASEHSSGLRDWSMPAPVSFPVSERSLSGKCSLYASRFQKGLTLRRPFALGQVPVDLAAYEAAKASEPEFYRAGDSMLYGVRSYGLSCLLAGAWQAQLSISGAESATMCALPMACPLMSSPACPLCGYRELLVVCAPFHTCFAQRGARHGLHITSYALHASRDLSF